jgi:hypothetical protein
MSPDLKSNRSCGTSLHQNQDTWHLPFRVQSYFLFTDNSRFWTWFEASITGFFLWNVLEKYNLMLWFYNCQNALVPFRFRLFLI